MADFTYVNYDSATPGEEMVATPQMAVQEETTAASSGTTVTTTGLVLEEGLVLEGTLVTT